MILLAFSRILWFDSLLTSHKDAFFMLSDSDRSFYEDQVVAESI